MNLRTNAPAWFNEDHPEKQAKCVLFPANSEYDPWYVDTEEESDEAKAICSGLYDGKPCPLLEQCLEFAMSNNERYGIWGGMTPEERAQLRKERRVWQRKGLRAVGQSPLDD